ncbi:hypothetical protein Zmor_011469 [Zophobas morio]|uniref:Uncharacterized protein n=1 Tax=Zophobas morio TaxID=2755281 RepID=A0AA38IQ77_9CUCU|nr:hypothetical protein Zmor_011469 [Zophobas morio]
MQDSNDKTCSQKRPDQKVYQKFFRWKEQQDTGEITEMCVAVCLLLSRLVRCQNPQTLKKILELEEDRHFLKESVAKFGSPQGPNFRSLPGPEVELNDEVLKDNIFLRNAGNFTYRYRQKSRHVTYNGRYETTRTTKINGKEILVVRGQFTEEFPCKYGGVYIRTIGYTFDENGFRTFLIDVSKVVAEAVPIALDIPAAPVSIASRMQYRGPAFKRTSFPTLAGGGLG